MQFLALSRRRAEFFADNEFKRRLETEAAVIRDLRQAGFIRRIWRRGDVPGACLLIEAKCVDAARAALEVSPLIQAGLFEIGELVPLLPYRPAIVESSETKAGRPVRPSSWKAICPLKTSPSTSRANSP